MPVYIGNTKYNNEFRTAQDLNYLLACIGEKITVEIEYYYEDIAIALQDLNIICHPDPADVGSFADRQELVYCPDSPIFNDYNVGDTFNIAGSAAGNNGTGFTVTEVISGNLIRVAGSTFVNEILPWGAGAYIANSTPLNGIRFFYNLLNGSNNYTSLIDGETQLLTNGTAYNVASQAMTFNGITSYQIGSAVVYLLSHTSERQTYKLIHTTIVTPFFLANQWSDLVSRIKPSYYNAIDCLRYIYKLQLSKNLSNPLSNQILQVSQAANTGWFNENFNGGINYYSINQFSLVRNSDSAAITQLEFGEVIDFTIKIRNTTNSPFSNTNTKFTLNFIYLPEDETLYQNNGRTLQQNFNFDRCLFTLGGAAAVGELPLGYRVIKTVTATFDSTSQVTLTGQFEINSLAQGIMTEGDFSRYAIWVTTENHATSASNTDKVALLATVSEVFSQTVESDLITNVTKFIKHPYTDVADGEPSTEVFPVDDVAAHSKFSIDFTGRESDGIKINKINTRIFLTNGVDADIILDDYVLNTNAYPLIASLFQNINFQQNRIYNIPAGEIRKVIDIQNEFALDAGLVHNWYINFPFMVRWEYYLGLLGVSSPPAGIFDTAEQHNGINNFWHRMTTVAGWQLKYYVKFFFEQQGDTATQTFESSIVSHDYQSNPEWINETIKSYSQAAPVVITAGPLVVGTVYTITTYMAGDDFTNVGGTNVTGDVFTATGTTPTTYTNGSALSGVVVTELSFTGNKYLQGYEDTKIVASFEWDGVGASPVISDVLMVLWIERFEASGVSEIRRISSRYVLDSGSWFSSIDGSDLVVLDKVGDVFTGTCLVNSSILPPASKYTIYARLYHLPTASTGDKEFNNDDDFDFQDASPFDFQ